MDVIWQGTNNLILLIYHMILELLLLIELQLIELQQPQQSCLTLFVALFKGCQ